MVIILAAMSLRLYGFPQFQFYGSGKVFFFFQRCATSISQRSAVILPVITFQRYPARVRPAAYSIVLSL